MSEVISRFIDNEEILVRFVFSTDFKKGIIDEAKFIEKDFFFDTRGGVSLQRERYSNENTCKIFAKKNAQSFAGFVVFRKSSFDKLLAMQQSQRPEFLAEILATPLDSNLQYIPPPIEVTTDTPLNPAHADIIYINPASSTTDDSTHTFRRVFTKNLFKNSKLLIDVDPSSEEFDIVFNNII